MFTICSHFPYLNDSLSSLNTKLGGTQFHVTDGQIQWKETGADTWNFFSSASKVTITFELALDGGSTTTPKIVNSTAVYEKQEGGKWLCNGTTTSPWLHANWTVSNYSTVYGGARILSVTVE